MAVVVAGQRLVTKGFSAAWNLQPSLGESQTYQVGRRPSDRVRWEREGSRSPQPGLRRARRSFAHNPTAPWQQLPGRPGKKGPASLLRLPRPEQQMRL